ncbi:MAG: PD-(D/E)XK motif protein [Flavobacterium sp.]|jgi:hypothetical protein
MKMMERINQIWAQLELNSSTVAGLFKLRFSDASKCDFFLGVKLPETHRLLILKVPFNIGKEFNFKYEFRGLKFEKIYDPDDSKFLLLNLVLVEKQFKDVFDTLVADIISGLLNENDIRVILKNYSNRLIKWQSLFERFSQEGLTPEQQRGLFGELYFLRKYLQAYTNQLDILNTWIGTERQVRDFQSGTWAVEVKTTHGNNHQKVHISSERQLDTTNLDNLFLYHISLEQMQNSGESLNDIVDSVLEYLQSDALALNKFKSKIYEVGYFDLQRSLYESIGYFIRQNIFYKVENDFPRIQENEIRVGIGDVKYSIILSQCTTFIVDEEIILETIIPQAN